MANDRQRSVVYAWEREVFPNLFTEDYLTVEEVRSLILHICETARGNGRKARAPVLRLTGRNGGGCARWDRIMLPSPNSRGGKNGYPRLLVLHEMAHVLTYGTPDTLAADPEGHGPRFVACYLALVERYSSRDTATALQRAQEGFEVRKVVFSRVSPTAAPGAYQSAVRVRKCRVRVDTEALAMWREAFRSHCSTVPERRAIVPGMAPGATQMNLF